MFDGGALYACVGAGCAGSEDDEGGTGETDTGGEPDGADVPDVGDTAGVPVEEEGLKELLQTVQ